MAKAMKCDICGVYYDSYEYVTAKEAMERTPNRIEFGANFIDSYGDSNFIRYRPPKKSKLSKLKQDKSVYDICPDCFKDIVEIIMKKNKEESE